MGNTAAVKLGDGVDWFLMQSRESEKRHLLEQEGDYPETTTTLLHLFIKIWKLPSGAVPSKKKKNLFAQWVLELGELNELFGSPDQMEKALTIALENYEAMPYPRFPVSHPLAIKKLLISALSEINRTKEKEQPTVMLAVQEEVKVEQLASPEHVKSVIRDLKSMFDDEEE